MTQRIHAMRPEMIRLRDEEHKTLVEIGKLLGIGKTTVRTNLIEAGAYQSLCRDSTPWREEEDTRLIKGREDGLTGQALTALFPDRVHGTVLNHLHALREAGAVR